MWEDDICWCADSERCTHTECFRHMDNRTQKVGIFTMSHLMGVENLCPLTEEGEN